MKFSEEQKKEIKDIEATAKTVGEPFQVKCFEVLLNHWVNSSSIARPEQKNKDAKGGRGAQGGKNTIPCTTTLSVFMGKYEIAMDALEKILYINDDDKVEFHDNPPATSMAGRIVQWTLLWSLCSAIKGTSFAVNPKELYAFCMKKGCDRSNFWSTLKQQKNSLLFSGLLQSKGETRTLTAKGKVDLASLIRQMAGDGS